LPLLGLLAKGPPKSESVGNVENPIFFSKNAALFVRRLKKSYRDTQHTTVVRFKLTGQTTARKGKCLEAFATTREDWSGKPEAEDLEDNQAKRRL